MADDKLLKTEKQKKSLENEIKNEIVENFDKFCQFKEELQTMLSKMDMEVEEKFKELYK